MFWGAHRTSNILRLGGEECRSKNSSLLEGLKGKKKEGRSVPEKVKHRHKGLGTTLRVLKNFRGDVIQESSEGK